MPKELVIDGQQRLTALVATMRGVAVKDQTFSERRIRIAYDPVSREFHTWDAAIGKDPRYIPDVSAVFEAKRNNQLSKFQRAYVKGYNAALERRGEPPLGDDQEVSVEDGLNELLSLETTYVMPILSISNKVDEEQMSQIFIRVNSGETKLNEDTAELAKGCEAVCVFVNDTVNAAVIDRLCEHFGAGSSDSVLIRSCLEISNISGLRGTPYGLLPFISAICSFGGLCIVFQLGAVRSSGVSLVPFLISRVPLAAISFLISLFLRRQFLPTALPAFSVKRDVFVRIDNFTPSFCLIMLILLLNLKRTLAFSKRV